MVNHRQPSFILKEWIAIGIAVCSFVFSAGVLYFKVATLEKTVDEFRIEYVRKDVQTADSKSIDQRLNNIEKTMGSLDVKIDSITVSLNSRPLR